MRIKAKESAQVESYFHNMSRNWDEIYSEDGRVLYTWLNKRFRKGVYNRATKVLEIVREERQHVNSVLDVGCGSGRIALQLAEIGVKITAIDFVKNMITLAENFAKKTGLEKHCCFIHGDFMEYCFNDHSFDISIAMGVLDYVPHAIEFLEKMKRSSSYMILVTFPIKNTFRSYIRKIRLSLKKCPVSYYDMKDLEKMFSAMQFSEYTIETVNNQFFVAARI